ncbi:MAG TPA: acyltransferase, partial [Polyangiaceae bacterium]|nr:acyltransferase [Polyangiaceae bacterium]
CVVRWLSHGTLAKASVASEFFFVQNYGQPLWIHTWSLAVEEHFYLVLSLLFAVARLRKKAFNPLPWALSAMVLCPIARGLSHQTALYLTHQRIDALFFGVLLRWAFGLPQVRRRLPMGPLPTAALAVAAIALMAPVAIAGETTPWMRTLGLTALYLGAGALLAATVEGQLKPRGLLARILAKIGFDSYSIYLWHLPILGWSARLAARLPGAPPIAIVVAQVLLCVLLGVGLARAIERPFLKLRDRWFPTDKSAAAVHPELLPADRSTG